MFRASPQNIFLALIFFCFQALSTPQPRLTWAVGRIYPWGNQTTTCEYAVMDDGSGNGCGRGNAAWAVGSKPKGVSPYGAHDMAGNVWEWVAYWYYGQYYAKAAAQGSNPQGPATGGARVLRGGGWNFNWNYVRAAYRLNSISVSRSYNFGFRCVGVAPGQ